MTLRVDPHENSFYFQSTHKRPPQLMEIAKTGFVDEPCGTFVQVHTELES